jgi:hypothetical protein
LRTFEVTGIGARPLRFDREWSAVLPDWFEVVQADLDDDGRQEVILATLDGVGNGMGVAYWTVYALSPGSIDWSIDSLPVQEYSSAGSWVVLSGEKRCNLLQTKWANGFEAGRGWGLYFHASWQAFEHGAFVQRVDRPILRRRYLFGFARERGDTAVRAGAPWTWLRSANVWVSQ